MRFGPSRFSTYQACWCMQFPSPEKKHAFMTGLYRNARCLSSCERTRDKWAQTGMSRRWFCLSRSPRCGGQQNTRSGACHWHRIIGPDNYIRGILTLSVLWVAMLVRRGGQVVATQRFHSLVGRLRIGFFTSRGKHGHTQKNTKE